MIEAKTVIIKPIAIRVDFGRDPDFVKLIKSKLVGITLNQGKRINIFLFDSAMPFLVEKTEPEGDVTISENTVLQVASDYIRLGEHHWFQKSASQFGEEPSPSMRDPLLERFQLLITVLKDHERKLDSISQKLENLIQRLENVEKK